MTIVSKGKSASDPSGSSGRSLSRLVETTRYFTTSPGWDASLSQDYPQLEIRRFAQEHHAMFLVRTPPCTARETSALTITPPRLPRLLEDDKKTMD